MSIGVFGKLVLGSDAITGDSPTTTDVLGPFYRPGAPFRTNINPPGFNGTNLHLSGTIFKDDGRTPFHGCLIEVWQADKLGKYDTVSDDYVYRGAAKTGADGKYHFTTSMPVPYVVGKDGTGHRPAHIHLRVAGAAGEQDLISQIYFKGDPYLAKDLYSSSASSVNRILSVTKNAKGEDLVHFDIVMSKEFPLDAAAFEKITGVYDMGKGVLAEFFRKGNLLFAKVNGQIEDAWHYKGNNTFEDGMGSELKFEILPGGGAKVKVVYVMDLNRVENFEGTKFLKY